MTGVRFLLIAISCLMSVLCCAQNAEVPSSSANNDFEHMLPNIDNYLPLYLQPVTLTDEGIKKLYLYMNHPLYTERFLPRCFLHVIDLLSYVPGQEHPYEYIKSFMSIFQQKIKQCTWINPFAFIHFLEKLPELVREPLAMISLEHEEESLQEYFYDQLLHHSEEWNTDPRGFSLTLAQEVSAYIEESVQRYSLRVLITRFIESCIDKLIWSYLDGEYTWKTCKSIGHHIETLYNNGTIPDIETAQQLLWSLVSRFCYYLELSAPMLPLELYQAISSDIAEKKVSWLQYPENDAHLTPKVTYLQHAVEMAQTRTLLYTKHDKIT